MFGLKKDKRTFFEKLSGATEIKGNFPMQQENKIAEIEEEEGDGQLTVDVYQTPGEIIIKTMVAGVKPEDLDISITREMVTIRGKRESEHNVTDEDYFYSELYWGTFSRSILLPQEIDTENVEAIEKHGLLILKLPKLIKNKHTKVKIKSVE